MAIVLLKWHQTNRLLCFDLLVASLRNVIGLVEIWLGKKKNTQWSSLKYRYCFKYYIFIYVHSYKTNVKWIFNIFTVFRALSLNWKHWGVMAWSVELMELKVSQMFSSSSFNARAQNMAWWKIRVAVLKGIIKIIKWSACDCSWIYWQISSPLLVGFGTRWWLDAPRGW